MKRILPVIVVNLNLCCTGRCSFYLVFVLFENGHVYFYFS